MLNAVAAAFDKLDDAMRAARELDVVGFTVSDLSIVANQYSTNAPWTNVCGSEARFLRLATPSVGVIYAAGPIVAALADADADPPPGGLIAGFRELGVAQGEIETYVEIIRRGGAVMALRADHLSILEAEKAMRRHHAINLAKRVVRWQNAGWLGFDPDAIALSPEQIAVEQAISAEDRALELAEAELRR